MARLKVFRGNIDGVNYVLVATTSKSKAMSLVGQPNKARFDKYFSISTVNGDCKLALASPEMVFTKKITVPFGDNNPWLLVN